MGKSKLAPQSEPTIPRLELCAVELAELIQEELDLKLDSIKFYTDSRVVLGYIHNQSRRFYVYVHNRVQRIRQTTNPDQWHYVRTEDNPADIASRSVPASRLTQTMWFRGPTFLRKPSIQPEPIQSFSLVSPELDAEIRPDVKSYATQLHEKGLSIERFERFSTFDTLQRAVALLIHIARSFKSPNIMDKCRGWHTCELPRSPDEPSQAREVIIRAGQRKAFGKEFEALERDKPIPLNSCLRRLNPILQNDLICIGGRLKNADVEIKQKNPVILPKDNHVSLLFIRHHHTQVKHQGRHLTEGAVRAAGLWILGDFGVHPQLSNQATEESISQSGTDTIRLPSNHQYKEQDFHSETTYCWTTQQCNKNSITSCLAGGRDSNSSTGASSHQKVPRSQGERKLEEELERDVTKTGLAKENT
ncbi:unnamed protein product [Leuciscus chuanchicus]